MNALNKHLFSTHMWKALFGWFYTLGQVSEQNSHNYLPLWNFFLVGGSQLIIN